MDLCITYHASMQVCIHHRLPGPLCELSLGLGELILILQVAQVSAVTLLTH